MPASKQQERRFVPKAEVRLEEGSDGPILTGYAAVFETWSVDLWGFREKIRKGAFKKTIKEADIRGLINHDSNLIFGRSAAGTLELKEDDDGLRYESPLDNGISYVSDLIKSVGRGDISGNSFTFEAVEEEWKFYDDRDKLDERVLTEVRLFDVGPVTYPAYPQTSLDIRAITGETLELDRLNYLIFRVHRGHELPDTELEFLQRSIKTLQSYLPGQEPEEDKPEEPEPEFHSEGREEEPEPEFHSEEKKKRAGSLLRLKAAASSLRRR